VTDLVLTWEVAAFLEAGEEGLGIGKLMGRIQVHKFLQNLRTELAGAGQSGQFLDGVNDATNAVLRQHGSSLAQDPCRLNRVDVDTSFDRGPALALYESLVQSGIRPGVIEAALDVKREVDEAVDSYDEEYDDWKTGEEENAPDPDDEDFADYEPEEQPDPGYRDGHVHVLQCVQAHFGIADEELDE
jgi:hypothetical protein